MPKPTMPDLSHQQRLIDLAVKFLGRMQGAELLGHPDDTKLYESLIVAVEDAWPKVDGHLRNAWFDLLAGPEDQVDIAGLLTSPPYSRHITSPKSAALLISCGDLRNRRIREIQLSASVRGNVPAHSPNILSVEAQIWLVQSSLDAFKKFGNRPPNAFIPGLAIRRKEARALNKAIDVCLSQNWPLNHVLLLRDLASQDLAIARAKIRELEQLIATLQRHRRVS